MKNLIVPSAARATLRNKLFPQHPENNIEAIRSTIRGALSSAGLNVQDTGVGGIAATIDQALSAAGLRSNAAPQRVQASVIPRFKQPSDAPPVALPAHAERAGPGEFVSRSFTCRAGTRAYKLYIPSSYSAQAERRLPLVVMLHGCTQSADDFAAGTRMNEIANQHGFLVVYPEQAANANGSRCWNWFRAGDQQRDSGEPSLIAGITGEIVAAYRVDERRIYVAGLSAGAAMAVVLGATYPDLYAAVGAHSGLPYAAAHDVPSAFAAMKSGASRSHGAYRENTVRQGVRTVPTIVFHGDADQTVTAANGEAIVDQAIGAAQERTHFSEVSDEGLAAGYAYTRTQFAIGADTALLEHWVIRGGGHAWSGGSTSGSYTDPQGPDASAEMIRFFQTHAR